MRSEVEIHHDRESEFKKCLDLSRLTYQTVGFYKPNDRAIPSYELATNNIGSGRLSLTSIAFGYVTELFVMAQIMQHTKNGFVLDVGCGEPSLFHLLCNSMCFPKYIGLDVRPNSLLSYGNNSNLVKIYDDASKTEYIKPGSIKVIVLSEVLEHLSFELGHEILTKFLSWLTPDGVVVLTCPIIPVGVEIDMEKEKEKWEHITYYHDDVLVDYLESLGFSVIHKSYGKFMGRRTTYKTVRNAMIAKYGDVGSKIFDEIGSIWTPRLAGTIFTTYAGDACGHIQLVLRKS